MDKLLKGVRTVLYWFSVGAMCVMLAIIFAQVVTRYLFNYTPDWSEELARFLFVWVVFLGSALIMGEGGHLAVQMLPEKFKGRPLGHAMEIVVNVSGYAFIGLLLRQGWKMTSIMTFQLSPGLNLPMSWVYVVIPLSSVLMLLYLLRDSVRIVKTLSGRGAGQEG